MVDAARIVVFFSDLGRLLCGITGLVPIFNGFEMLLRKQLNAIYSSKPLLA